MCAMHRLGNYNIKTDPNHIPWWCWSWEVQRVQVAVPNIELGIDPRIRNEPGVGGQLPPFPNSVPFFMVKTLPEVSFSAPITLAM